MESKHSVGVIPIVSSKFLERFSYYGMRSLILLYLINGTLYFSREEASSFYSVFIYGGALALLGGLFGDLAFGSRRTVIIGGFMQAAGYFILAIPHQGALYVAIFLILTGSGLYAPNLLVMLNLLYKEHESKLDSAMTILYTAINLGAFLAGIVCVFLKDVIGFAPVFILCGFLMLGSAMILLLAGSVMRSIPYTPNIQLAEIKVSVEDSKKTTGFILVLLLIPIFWAILDLVIERKYNIISAVQNSIGITNGFYLSETLVVLLTIMGGIIFALIWSFSKLSSYLKISIGFAVYVLAFIILILINQENPGIPELFFLVFALFLEAVAELFIGPIALSVILRHGPQRFQSTIIASYLTLLTFTSLALTYLVKFSDSFPTGIIFLIVITVLSVMCGLFLWMYLRNKKQ